MTDTMPSAGTCVVPAEGIVELGRIETRWRQLPLAQALSRMPLMLARLAELTPDPVPDLGPAVIIDQLKVLVWDACAGARPGGIPEASADGRADGIPASDDIAAWLADLRRALA